MAIPRIIHQLWKDEALPPRYQALQDSWRRHNPGFEIRLWTDRDMEALVERRYPHLLSLYQAYEKHVCRTDLARYLILDRFGGVYADLDCECLKPIEPLIANERLVIAPEPDSHSDRKAVEGPGLGRLLCPTFMASEPGHRFWTHLVERIRKVPLGATVMEATGPHVLTAAHETFPESATITLLPAETVYPFDDIASHSGRIYDIEFWERSTRHAYAIHYWDGTWYEHGPRPDGLPTNFSFAILNRGRSAAPPLGQRPPSISCLMAPGADEVRVLQALESMRSQTWPHMQLVVPGEALGAAARRKIAGQADVTIVDRPSSASWIVAGLEQSRGEAIALWDPLELSDPRRLEIQYLAGRHTGSSVCLMRRRLIWQPGARRLGVSGAYPVASSLTGERSLIAAHGSAETADALLAAVMKDVQVTTVNSPRLCVVIADEDDPAFEATWAAPAPDFLEIVTMRCWTSFRSACRWRRSGATVAGGRRRSGCARKRSSSSRPSGTPAGICPATWSLSGASTAPVRGSRSPSSKAIAATAPRRRSPRPCLNSRRGSSGPSCTATISASSSMGHAGRPNSTSPP